MKYRKKPVQLLPNMQSVKECYQFLHQWRDHPTTQDKWYEYCEMIIKKGETLPNILDLNTEKT